MNKPETSKSCTARENTEEWISSRDFKKLANSTTSQNIHWQRDSRSLPSSTSSYTSGIETRGKEIEIEEQTSYKTVFRGDYKTKIVQNFPAGFVNDCLYEALGFFEKKNRIPPVKFYKSSVLININSGNELVQMNFVAYNLEESLEKLSLGVPVQFFFIQRSWGLQLVFIRPVAREDPVCKLHKFHFNPTELFLSPDRMT